MKQRYRKKADSFIIAVQLNLETEGFTYHKWGALQQCKKDDWLVNNAGKTYTIDAETFAKTYRMTTPGIYTKSTPVWVGKAAHDGSVFTKKGESHYRAGDYILSNDEDGSDNYCMSPETFESMYELDC
jgi:hypothetical protein